MVEGTNEAAYAVVTYDCARNADAMRNLLRDQQAHACSVQPSTEAVVGGGGGSQYSSAAGGGGLTEEPVGRPGRGEAGALALLEDSSSGGGTTVQWSEGGGFDDGPELATPEDELFEPEAVVYETGPVRWAYPQAGGDAGGSTTTMSAGGDAPRRLAIGGVYLEDAESPAGDAQATLYYDPNVTYAIWKEYLFTV
jgi:hypothetical protein